MGSVQKGTGTINKETRGNSNALSPYRNFSQAINVNDKSVTFHDVFKSDKQEIVKTKIRSGF